jgi:hypothetical protein
MPRSGGDPQDTQLGEEAAAPAEAASRQDPARNRAHFTERLSAMSNAEQRGYLATGHTSRRGFLIQNSRGRFNAIDLFYNRYLQDNFTLQLQNETKYKNHYIDHAHDLNNN